MLDTDVVERLCDEVKGVTALEDTTELMLADVLIITSMEELTVVLVEVCDEDVLAVDGLTT